MITISFNYRDRGKVLDWIANNESNVAYTWLSTSITFHNPEDAVSFTLAVGGVRIKSRLEKMLEIENEKDPD